MANDGPARSDGDDLRPRERRKRRSERRSYRSSRRPRSSSSLSSQSSMRRRERTRSPRVHKTRGESRKRSRYHSKSKETNKSCRVERSHSKVPNHEFKCNQVDATLFTQLLDVMRDYKDSDRIDRFPVLNVIADFDPMAREQTVDTWLKKVEECALIYNWSDKQKIHYALPKLSGVAKTWYQGLPSALYSWEEWKDKLLKSFPSRENYAELLTEMLRRKAKFGDSLEMYYYTKLNLLNRCSIFGKNAVDCIIDGIEDRGVMLSVQAAQFTEPEQLLQYFKTIKGGQSKDLVSNKIRDRKYNFANPGSSDVSKYTKLDSHSSITCYNCNNPGHRFYQCPKPIIKCKGCGRRGHTENDCPKAPNKISTKVVERDDSKTVMEVTLAEKSSSKYRIPVKINGNALLAHIDLGSDCTLMRVTDANNLNIIWEIVDSPILKGLGNVPYRPLGEALVTIDIQGVVEKNVKVLIIDDHMISCPILIGHTYTERPTILITKTASDLIIKRSEATSNGMKVPLFTCEQVVLRQDKLSLINVRSNIHITGTIYVHGDVRGRPNNEYFLLPGEYEILDGMAKLFVQCLSTTQIQIPNDTLVTRAYSVRDTNKKTMSVLGINFTDESTLQCGKISSKQKGNLVSLLNKYHSCFSTNLHELGFTTATEMVIHLKDSVPVVYRPYRLSFADRRLVQNMVQEMLDCGIVRESVSPYASPIVLVQKKSGEKRLCVDYRALNNKTIKEHYPLPRVEDQLDLLSGSSLFISLDLASGYYQIPIEEQSKDKTAFVTPDGQFEYNRMPFGLVNAPSVFQRAINKILNQARVKYALIYMDDILIPAKTFEEGLLRLEEVLRLLKEGGLTLKLSKCKFFYEKIDYLGFEISSSGIRPGSLKTDAVSKFPEPKNQHDVRRFLGLASFFRRFIKDFAILARPLTALLKKDAKWLWGHDEQQSFQSLKNCLIKRPVLALYNPDAETELHTDASKLGVAGILLQKNSNNLLQPIAYYSRQTNSEEQKLHSFELETLAVVSSLNKFRVYLLGIQFKIYTDCNALRTTFTKRDLIPRIARWWIQFQEFDCSIEHKPGHKMAHVDALSRHAIPSTNTETRVLDILTVDAEDWIATMQGNDEKIKHIKEVLSDPNSVTVKDILKNYKLKNGRVYRILGPDTLRWVVPRGARWQILKANHDNVGHFGFTKTLDRIKALYWFPKMKRFTKKYVDACLECAHHKMTGTTVKTLHPIPKIDIPFHTIHADHLGPFIRSKRQNTYILVIVDAFTKFVNLTAVRNTRSITSVRVLKNHFSYFGMPTRLITDQGTSFTGKRFREFISSMGIKHVFNAVATPRANGQVERYNRTILAALGAMTHDKPKNMWDEYLPDIQLGINTTIHAITNKTPTELLFGRRVTNPTEGILNDVIDDIGSGVVDSSLKEIRDNAKSLIDTQQEKLRIRSNNNKRNPIFKVGDLVRAIRGIPSIDGQSRKLEPKFRGPYKIKKVLPNDRYVIEDTPITQKGRRYEAIVAIDKLKPWLSFQNANDGSSTSSCSEISDSENNI